MNWLFQDKWRWSKPRLSPAEKALQASVLAVSTRDVGRVREVQQLATLNGLRAVVSAECRARYDATMSAIEGLGSSQSQPVPGRHRAARNLKVSPAGWVKPQ